MRHEIHKHDVQLTPELEKIINQKIAKLDKRLETYHPDAAHLDLQLKHVDKTRSHVECSLTLHAFHEEMHTHKGGGEIREALDDAFDALFKEMDHYRARVNKSLNSKIKKAGES